MKTITYIKTAERYGNTLDNRFYQITKKEIEDIYGLTPNQYIKKLIIEAVFDVKDTFYSATEIKINIINDYNGKEYQFMNLAEEQSLKKCGIDTPNDIYDYIFV